MVPFWELSTTGALVEVLLTGLIFALLILVGIWVANELRAGPGKMKGGNGSHLNAKELTKVFRNRHATK